MNKIGCKKSAVLEEWKKKKPSHLLVQHGKGNLNNLEDKIKTFVAVLLRQRIAKFHTEIFIGQMHVTHTMKQSHVQ